MSETTNLKLFKHDNPSTNTNPFDVEQALNENWDKIDTAVGDLQNNNDSNKKDIADLKNRVTEIENDLETVQTDITNIKAEQTTQNNNIEANSTAIETNAEAIEQNKEDITDLQAENANLRAQIPTGTAAGEEISLSDSAEMELVDFGLQGNSKQAIREGYNLLPPFESTVLNGITYTKNEDGTITVNGTASADSFYRQNINLEEGDYYLSGSPTGGANNTYYLQAMGFGEAGNDYGSGTTFKVTTSSSVGIKIMIYQGVTVNNLVFKPMIVKGTEKKDYEQYGVSPSLDYPSEVEAVGDNINLYPFESIEFQSDTPTESWCYIDGKVGAYGNTVTDKTDYKITLEKGKYYFKLETDDSNIITGGLVANDTNSEKQLTLFDNAFEITETTVCTLRLKVANPSLGINIKSIKLEKGTAATPYSPYGQGNIEIIHNNKNELILNDNNSQRDGLNFSIKDGVITISGTATSTYQGLYIPVKRTFNEDYVLSTNAVGSKTGLHIKAAYKLENGNLQYPDIFTRFVFPTNSYLEQLYVIVDSGSTIDATIKLQLEKGTEVSDFTVGKLNKYILPIQKPFYKIGDYKDSFVKQNKKWYEQHFIEKFDLSDENIDWHEDGAGQKVNTYRWDNRIKIENIDSANSRNNFSNYFSKNYVGYNNDEVGFGLENSSFRVRLPVSISTPEQVKSFWQEKAKTQIPYIYYVLATPELIECTEEQTQVLEQIIADGTYKEVTHFYTTDDLKPTIEVKYYKDLETLFNKQAELENTLNNVQAQILELGGN